MISYGKARLRNPFDVVNVCFSSMIDSFKVPSLCTSLTFSPTGEYLASVHEETLGIFLWTNKTIYGPVTLASMDVDAEPELLTLPGTATTAGNAFSLST